MKQTVNTRKLQTLSRLLILLIASKFIIACGGSDDARETFRSSPTDYSKLKLTPVEAVELQTADADSLSRHLKNGLRLQTYTNRIIEGRNTDLATNAAPAELSSNESNDFSETNTHVEGVDEADYIKYDGSHIFLSTHPHWDWYRDTPTNAKIRILATDPEQASAEEVSSIEIDDGDSWGAASELYLVEENGVSSGLATLRSTWQYYAWNEPVISDVALTSELCFAPQANTIQVSLFDVSEAETPNKSWEVAIDGFLQNSRKIDNTLYLVTQYSPAIPGFNFWPQNEADVQENETLLDETPLNELLPSMRINNGEVQALVEASDCLLPLGIDANNGFSSITTLVAIDLENQEISAARCLNANVQGIYASLDNFYIGGSSTHLQPDTENRTVIHKFNLENGEINYRSTGVVPGWLSWQDASFRMSEHDESFRVVTSWRDADNELKHRLSILRDNPSTDQMMEIAALPNSTRPQAIGKPGEDIFAVRFRDDRAYIVTFFRVDPLYVLDLSNDEDPFIAGELEVPGFSSYLHPVGDNYLLGFGVDADNFSQGGLKVSLYDVSNANDPIEINSMLFGERGSYSEALYNLHAATFLQSSSDQLRFTLPMTLYGQGYNWSHNSLALFEINGLDSDSADLFHVGEIVSESSSEERDWPLWYAESRSVLHNDAVYYAYGDMIYSAFWSSPQAARGPY